MRKPGDKVVAYFALAGFFIASAMSLPLYFWPQGASTDLTAKPLPILWPTGPFFLMMVTEGNRASQLTVWLFAVASNAAVCGFVGMIVSFSCRRLRLRSANPHE
jgi:hypothetical protein